MAEELKNIEEFILSVMKTQEGFEQLNQTNITNIINKIKKHEVFNDMVSDYKQYIREEKLKRLLDE